ncbi:MAG: hypothetical protein COA78_23195 [Blastopirellula sp.]|nr:MAG: hypothetical protein COA78_23195 [Blastopirellula sp.]
MTQRVPTVRPISWLATIPQFIAGGVAIVIGCLVTQSTNGVPLGAGVYLIYSLGSRSIIPAAHCRGMRLFQNQKFEEAILAYEESYEFFTRYAWLDKYRSITMMTPGAMCYREMALNNIAFAHGQIGNGDKAKEFYQRTLDEYPNNIMASAALKMIESVECSTHEVAQPDLKD